MGNSFTSRPVQIFSGAAPLTGAAINIFDFRECFFSVYASGNVGGSVGLEAYVGPFLPAAVNPWINFYTFSGGPNTGFFPPVFLDSPMPQIRANVSGTGTFWVSLYGQN